MSEYKKFLTWMKMRDWCLLHPNEKAAIFQKDGYFNIEFVPLKPEPTIIQVKHYDEEPK